jgi:glycosyltransferase 2 family protein
MQERAASDTWQRWAHWLKRATTLLFLILVPALLFYLVRTVDWSDVLEALRSFSLTTLLAGVGIAIVSWLVFSGYDLLGRIYTRHGLPTTQVLPVAFVCYAFNLNFGAWVGGVALRYRLYSRLGLGAATVTRILSLSVVTNWLGYGILAGCIFSLRMMELPEEWEIGATGLQLVGFAMLAAAGAYLLACGFSKRHRWTWRGHDIELPSLELALVQASLGAINWSLMAGLIYLLLPADVTFPSVLGALLLSSIVGVITHVPGGLGVLEAVFIALLQHQIAPGTLLAALIAYRAIYYLLPLSVAVVIYLGLEKGADALRDQNSAE